MKSPEEIKNGLRHCRKMSICSNKCKYYMETECNVKLLDDAKAYIEQLENTLNRLGEFGKLFMDYEGCPRGAMGRAAMPIEDEVLQMPQLEDVDGGKWIPVNADALHELVEKCKQLEERISLMLIQMKGDCGVCKHRNDERKLDDKQLGCRLSPACYECLKKDGRDMWEYEGLPKL